MGRGIAPVTTGVGGTASIPGIARLAQSGAGGFTPPAFNPPPGQDYCLDVQAADGNYQEMISHATRIH